jgi:predicted nucleic acid-binding protein
MIVADTSAWIDYFRGIDALHTDLLDKALSTNRIIIGDLIIAELLQGFRNDKDYDSAKKLIKKLEYRNLAGKEIAFEASQNYRALRSRGVTVRKTIDVIIGTFCIENKFELIHNDRDFDPMEKHLGLKVLR